MKKDGQVNGSDMLLKVGKRNVGHCTSHECDYSMETKDTAVKPVATKGVRVGMWVSKQAGKMSISISFDGLRNYSETEGGFKSLLAAFAAHEPVTVEAYERQEEDITAEGAATPKPYLVGEFLITSLKESNPAEDDATYSGTLESSDAPTVFAPAELTGEEVDQ